MSPSLSPMNQNLLMSSSYFIIPTNPDIFSTMAINSLSRVISRWTDWANKVNQLGVYHDADYPFPEFNLKFLGAIIQKYRLRNQKPTIGFEKWFNSLKNAIKSNLLPVLERKNMLFTMDLYNEVNISDELILSEIPDFNTLIARSQESSTPVFALTDSQIGLVGKALEIVKESVSRYREIFNNIANSIIRMVEKC